MKTESDVMYQGAGFNPDNAMSVSELLSAYKQWSVKTQIEALTNGYNAEYSLTGYDLYNYLLPEGVDRTESYVRAFIKTMASIDMIIAAESDAQVVEGYIELRRHEPGIIRQWQGFLYTYMKQIQYFTTIALAYCLTMTGIQIHIALKHSSKVI